MDKGEAKKFLQQIKNANAQKKREEERQEEIKVCNRVNYYVSELVPLIVNYLIENNVSYFHAELKENLFCHVKASFFDTRLITKKMVEAFNEFEDNDKFVIFERLLAAQLSEYGITYKRDFYEAGDFASASDIYKICCEIEAESH